MIQTILRTAKRFAAFFFLLFAFSPALLPLPLPTAAPAKSHALSLPSPKHSAFSFGSAISLSAQKGKFRDLIAGKQVGSEDFEISAVDGGWLARGNAVVKSSNGPETHITAQLQLTSVGTPVHYQWTAVTGPKKSSASVDFDAGTATVHLQVNGSRPFTQQFFFKAPNVVILDDNLYYQYAILASLYDWSRKGSQTFSVFIPQEMTPGAITVEAMDSETDNGKNLRRLRVRSRDLEIILYLDGSRLEKISVPTANADIVRQ